MDATVQELFSAGIAPLTQKTYRSGSKRFSEQYGISEPFPVNEQVLVYFVASLYRGGLSGGTVKSYLAAVRHAQIALGLGDPHSAEMPQLEYVSKGVKKMTAAKVARTRLPITSSVLLQLRQIWQSHPHADRMLLCYGQRHVCAFLDSCEQEK